MTVTVVNKYKEKNHVYCGRGSALGNPYVAKKGGLSRDQACDMYDVWFKEQVVLQTPQVINQLRVIYKQARHGDVNLGCFCAPRRCHCDTIKAFIDGHVDDAVERAYDKQQLEMAVNEPV